MSFVFAFWNDITTNFKEKKYTAIPIEDMPWIDLTQISTSYNLIGGKDLAWPTYQENKERVL